MRRTLTRGVVLLWLAMLGCQGEPAPAPAPRVQHTEPDATPVLPEPDPPVAPPPGPSPTVDRFVPPVVGKVPPAPLKLEYRTLNGDLGLLRPGTRAEHKFAVTNDSKIPWTVKFITPDCNCAVGQFSSKVIQPGETSQLTVEMRADQREGPVVGAIAIDFWEPESPKFLLYVRMEVRKPLSVLPHTVDLGRVGPTERVTQSVEVRNYTDHDLPPPQIHAPDWLQVQVSPVDKRAEDNRARQTWKLEIQADLTRRKSATGPEQLLVRTDDKLPPVAVPVTFNLKAPLHAAPDEVVFEKFTTGQVHEQTFLLETYPDLNTLTAKDLAFHHDLGDEFSAEVARQLGPHRFQIVVRYHPKAAYASIQGELTVRVRERDLPPARVKIKGSGG